MASNFSVSSVNCVHFSYKPEITHQQ